VHQVEKFNVVKVGVLGLRRIEWYQPRYLNGRDSDRCYKSVAAAG